MAGPEPCVRIRSDLQRLTWETVRTFGAGIGQMLEAGAEHRLLAPGTLLLTSGEPADAIWFVTEGVVRIFHGRPDEPQFTAKLLRAPVTLGIVEILNGTSWVGSVEALAEVHAVRVDAERFRAALGRDATFADSVLRELAEKFEGTMRLSRELGFDDAEMRLVRVLLEYAEHFGRPTPAGVEIRFPLPRERLARELGTARRTVDHALLSLRRQNLVWLSPKGWQVLAGIDSLRAHLAGKSARAIGARAR